METTARPKLAIIGASYLQLPLIEKAKELGYETHVFAWAADDVGESVADVFHPVSIIEKDTILEECREIGVRGICSIASDLAMVTVNYVANELGLVCNAPECAEQTTNKHAMREALMRGGDPIPKFALVDDDTNADDLSFEYPVIVKPTDRSGSRGIYKLDDPAGLQKAISRAIESSFERKALVEEYVGGKEYSVESVSYCGFHTFLAITEKRTTGAPHFIETGHIEPAVVDSRVRDEAWRVVEHALRTLGVEYGAAHSEVKIDDQGNVIIIEIGARMGGDCIGSHLVRYSTGIDFVKAVIQVACGDEPDLSPADERIAVESVFILTGEDMREFERLRREKPDRLLDVPFLNPAQLDKAGDSSTRAGCYIVRA